MKDEISLGVGTDHGGRRTPRLWSDRAAAEHVDFSGPQTSSAFAGAVGFLIEDHYPYVGAALAVVGGVLIA